MFKKQNLKLNGVLLGVCLSLFAASSSAQQNFSTLVEVEVDREITELDPRPIPPETEDTDAFNTAIVLTSYQTSDQEVRCAGFNNKGEVVGRSRTRLPGDGIKLIFASDLANGADFIGKVTCASRGEVAGSAFLVGSVFSDLKVFNQSERSGSFIRVPVSLTR